MRSLILKSSLIWFVGNLILVMFSLVFLSNLRIRMIKIGWPYQFYQRFKLNGSELDNHGWHFNNLIIDQIIVVLLSVIVAFVVSKIKRIKN